jgi:hypothetical protein
MSESILVGATNTESFGFGKPGPSLGNSKGFFMFLAADASSTIDFSKASLQEGVVDSSPSKDIVCTIVCSPSPLRTSKKDRIYRSSCPERYDGSAPPRQLYSSMPSHVWSAFDVTNAGDNASHSVGGGSNAQEEVHYAHDITIEGKYPSEVLEEKTARSIPNHSSKGILQRNESSKRCAIKRHGGSRTSLPHFKLVQQMKYAFAHPFLRLGKYYLRDEGRPKN